MNKYLKRKIKHACRFIPDKIYIELCYLCRFKRLVNLKKPKTYNEKLQWLKLYDRREIYTTMVDKYDVKKYVSDIIGEEYIIPTLGVYDRFEEIDFEKLPNQFVIKCTHDSDGLVIVKEKSQLDIESAKKNISEGLKRNYYYSSREWPYKNVKPRIIIEPYLEDDINKELRDYKFFTFSGKAKLLFIATNRQGKGDTYFDFYDTDFKHLDIINGHPMNPNTPEKPKNFEKMIELAEKLSKGFPHIRVDFYEVNGKVYFGELTLYHWGGLVPFKPEKWDLKLGEYIEIEKLIKKRGK